MPLTVLSIASHIQYLNGPAVLSSCATLNLSNISLSHFCSYAHCHGLTKAILFSSPIWGVAYLLDLHSVVFKDLKYLINKQSHEFSYNLGIIGLTTGINCLLLMQLLQIALKSMWLPIQIMVECSSKVSPHLINAYEKDWLVVGCMMSIVFVFVQVINIYSATIERECGWINILLNRLQWLTST